MTAPLDDHLELVGRQVAAAAHVLVACDYDGTLTPLANRPELATLAAPVRRQLQQLAAWPGTAVAVVSGRALADVRRLVDLPELIYAGNHGLEIVGPGCEFREPRAVQCSAALVPLAGKLERALAEFTGALVERKGLSLSVHFRRVAADRQDEARRLTSALVQRAAPKFRLRTGHDVLEVRPPVDWHKGAALLWLAERLPQPGLLTVYLGDDQTDEDAFAAVPDGVTIKVGTSAATQARYRVPGPDDVARFLAWLRERPRRIAH